MPTKIASVEFIDHDTTAALDYLISLAKNNQIASMVFAVRVKRGRCMFGATGSAADPIAAAGMTALLHHHTCRVSDEHK
jgi:hypothetical protein